MKYVLLIFIVVSVTSVLIISLHDAKPLPDNPDIRHYMDIGTSGVNYGDLKKHLPQDMISKEGSFKREHVMSAYPGNVYYDQNVTNRVCFKYIRIQQKGKHWSYAGTFYFNTNNICFAVNYESWTRHMASDVPKNYWHPPVDWSETISER